MRSVINQLIQLQELILIRDEQRSLSSGTAKLERINADIESLTSTLPPAIKANFQQLYHRDHIAVAPINDGRCSICNMQLATASIQAIRLCRNIQVCPSCARILYDPSGSAKWVAARPKRSEGGPKSGIARFSSESLMIPKLQAKTKEDAIKELATLMEKERFVDDAQKLVDAALVRESIVSTAIGHGLAFPHVRGIEGGGLALALGVSKEGIAFDGKSSDKCHFIFFSTIPTAVSAFYLKLIAGLSEAFQKAPNRTSILDAKDPEALWKALSKATRYTLK